MARTRKKKPSEVLEDVALLRGTSRFELYRRMRDYAQRHLDQRLADGASERDVAWLRRDVQEFGRILHLDATYPLDSPADAGEPIPPPAPQPMAPPGYEAECADIMKIIVGEDA